jgi:hypothetical protein
VGGLGQGTCGGYAWQFHQVGSVHYIIAIQHGQGVTAAAVLVAKPPFQNKFLLRDCLQREK